MSTTNRDIGPRGPGWGTKGTNRERALQSHPPYSTPLALSEPGAWLETRFTSILARLPMTWHLCWPLTGLWLNLAGLREWTYSPCPSARTEAGRHWVKYFPEDVMERSDEGDWFQKQDGVFPCVVLWGRME